MSRIRVLVVDDSVVIRRLLSDVLSEDDRLEVVGTAANGKVALAKIPQLNPDLITLDVEMPVMDGLTTLRELRRLHPRIPVIMFSTLTEKGARTTLDALELGASDYVAKPANVGSVMQSMAAVRAELVPKVVALCSRVVPARPRPAVAPLPSAPAVVRRTEAPKRVDLLAIGSSTGGPDALSTVLSALPASLPVPVVVVQHMPPVFTRQFAERLNSKCALTVSEATSGVRLAPGHVLIAPGDHHMRLRGAAGSVHAYLDQGVPENYCRPAVDVLFRSVVEVYGGHVLGVVLTGMGADGARSSAQVVEAGGEVLVQDQATSVVWGMPGAVAAAGLASAQLPLREVAPAVLTRIARGRSATPLATRPATPLARPATPRPSLLQGTRR
ncbi:MAG: Chemotaxis response regulator protein-glutamate methylesterase CheB [uncultured Nocardioidaceae bacterium]|uniref:Protein-glutamate methylesterase/protein-glutamine glutaminase n=1 Tax=uncultured Nocardioidaceae bacterium TaxID=253824 RepID=A0A6J4MED8_9ACTN|nr:MAG: Chemotaxis response regulator protein-glutamate methylesterase CheB [uncultured Nocardioidaceae bacterium]